MKKTPLWFALSIIVLAIVVRLIPHPFNFTPVGAAALFAGATVERKRLAFAIPLIAMLLSDAVIGFHSGMPVVYACFAAIVCLGFALRGHTRSPFAVLGGALASASLFFVVTNFFVWMADGLYAHTPAGFTSCYAAALPFFENQLAGDAIYSAVLFGGLAWAQHRFPAVART